EDVAGEEHRGALLDALAHAVLEDLLHERVQPRGRLVEQQQVDVGGEGGDEGDLLLVAGRVVAGLLPRVEVEALDQVGASPFAQPAVRPRGDVDALPAGQPGPEGHAGGDVGEAPVQLGGVVPRVAAEELHGAAIGAGEAEQHADGGGLAG